MRSEADRFDRSPMLLSAEFFEPDFDGANAQLNRRLRQYEAAEIAEYPHLRPLALFDTRCAISYGRLLLREWVWHVGTTVHQ